MTNGGSVTPEAFALPGGPVGCLLLHGFTGSPPEMRLVGDYLHSRGLTVAAPLLPGHGTRPADLNRVRWEDWVSAAQEAFLALRRQCEVVFAGGLSMGALLAIHLGIMYPETAGVLLYSPALRATSRLLPLASVMRHIIRQVPRSMNGNGQHFDPEAAQRLWSYPTFPVGGAAELYQVQRVVRRELRDLKAPAIVFYTTADAALHPESGPATFEGLGCEDKELVTLHASGHCLTVDAEWQQVAACSYGFVAAHTNGGLHRGQGT